MSRVTNPVLVIFFLRRGVTSLETVLLTDDERKRHEEIRARVCGACGVPVRVIPGSGRAGEEGDGGKADTGEGIAAAEEIVVTARSVGETKTVVGGAELGRMQRERTIDSFLAWCPGVDLACTAAGGDKGCAVSVGVENLFDRDYEEVWGFPMPGTTVTLGVHMDF